MEKKGKIWAAGAIAAITFVILFTVIGEKNAPYPTVSEISHAKKKNRTEVLPMNHVKTAAVIWRSN